MNKTMTLILAWASLIFFGVGAAAFAALAMWGCTSTLKTGEQTFHFKVEVPVVERMLEGTTPQYWADRILDTSKKVETDESRD